MRKLIPFVALVVLGCGPKVTPNAEPVEIKGTVTVAGKNVTGVTLTLHAISEGAQASFPVVNGEFKGTAVPGTYTYYFTGSSTDFERIPEAYRSGSKERTVTIAPGTVLHIEM